MIEEPGIPGLLRIVRNLELELRRLKGRVDAVLEGTSISGGTIIGTPPDTSNAGFIHYDAVVDLAFLGVDGTLWKLITGSSVRVYATIQAAIDAWQNGDFNANATIRINRGSYSEAVVLDVTQPGYLTLVGEVGGRANGSSGEMPVNTTSIEMRGADFEMTLRNIVLTDRLKAGTGSPAASDGLRVHLENCDVDRIVGYLCDGTIEDCEIGSWAGTSVLEAGSNIATRVSGGLIQDTLGASDDSDVNIAGTYYFSHMTIGGGITGNTEGLHVATDKHFAFTDYDFGADLNFAMDGGTLTLDLSAFHLHNGARIVITDLGGGGTVIINWSGGSVEQTAAPIIEGDATIPITAVIDGVTLLGTPNSPAFKGQFVDSVFGECSPPSYVVEFL